MKTLYLFSNNYPYGVSETFLADEVDYLAKVFDCVYVIPLWGDGEKRSVKCSNVIVKEPILDFNPKKKAKLIVKGLFNTSPIPDIFHEIISGKGKFSKRLWITVTSALVTRCVLSSQSFRKTTEGICDHHVCYFYWGDMTANALPFMKKSVKRTFKAIARFHGSDLYEEAKGYIPFRKQLLDALDVVCTISKNGFDYLNGKYPSVHEKLFLSRLGSKDLGIEELSEHDEFRILSCSNIVEIKRLDLLANALRLIDDRKISWTHIGDGPLKTKIMELTRTFPDNIRVDFKGQMKHDALLDFVKKSSFDLFVNVSRSEGVPVSIMEAVSFGIPVVASDVGGTSEIVNSDLGILFPKDITPQQLKSIILRFSDFDEKTVLELRKSARVEWEKKWNMDSNYTSFADFIANR